jgi:hypothetical protein
MAVWRLSLADGPLPGCRWGQRIADRRVTRRGHAHAAKRARVQVLAASLLTAATLASVSGAEPAAAGTGPLAASSGFTAVGVLEGVAAVSARNAWAVGFTGSFSGVHGSLIVHWNGTAWRRVPSPASRGGWLNGVAATSAGNAWAVGFAGSKSLIVHWNGTMWKRAVSPSLPGSAELVGVAATSARNTWAVGCTGCTRTGTPNPQPLIVRWNGSGWKRVPSPTARGGVILVEVAATSASNAWAVGFAPTPSASTPVTSVILPWNGTAWRRVPSPGSRGGLLEGVAATSAGNAWAVGFSFANGKSLILRWNGAAWKLVPSPNPPAFLVGVAATSARNAWAVGYILRGPGDKPVILHWNGSAWKQVPSPTFAAGADLIGVAAASTRSAWAVGSIGSFTAAKPKTLVLHWNGSSWK